MPKLKLLFLTTAIVAAAAFTVACGDDDDNNQNQQDSGPVGNPDGGPNTDGGDGGVNSFPAYVQDQITNHTTSTGLPDPASVWDGLADDPAYVFPATFF